MLWSVDGINFTPVENEGRSYQGNWDADIVVRTVFAEPVRARFVRFVPLKSHEHTSMRVEVYGVDL